MPLLLHNCVCILVFKRQGKNFYVVEGAQELSQIKLVRLLLVHHLLAIKVVYIINTFG